MREAGSRDIQARLSRNPHPAACILIAMYLSPTTHGDRIRRCDAGRFVLYESTYAPATLLPRHYHNVAAMMFATRGSFDETVARGTLQCNTFDVLVRPAGEAHANHYGDRTTSCVIVNVPNDVATPLFNEVRVLGRAVVAPIAHRIGEELAFDDDAAH